MRKTNKNTKLQTEPRKVVITRLVLLILIAVWAYVVFSLSSQNGDESSGLSRKVVEFFIKDQAIVEIVEPYARKIAHFSEYGFGGMLFLLLFNTYKWNDRKMIATSILLGIWYAIMDEVHQLMVPMRHGSIFDIYLDSLGFSVGVLTMLLVLKIMKKTKRNIIKTE